LSTSDAHAIRTVVEPGERSVELGQVAVRLVEHRDQLSSVECDRGTLGIVLIVGRDQLGRRHNMIEIAAELGRARASPLPFVEERRPHLRRRRCIPRRQPVSRPVGSAVVVPRSATATNLAKMSGQSPNLARSDWFRSFHPPCSNITRQPA